MESHSGYTIEQPKPPLLPAEVPSTISKMEEE